MATIELEVKKIYPDISKSEQRAADFFLNNKEAIFHYPLATLAKMSKYLQSIYSKVNIAHKSRNRSVNKRIEIMPLVNIDVSGKYHIGLFGDRETTKHRRNSIELG